MHFPSDTPKEIVFSAVSDFLRGHKFSVIANDFDRPWGGFFVIDEGQAPQFLATFFPHLSVNEFSGFAKLSPKILVVAPNKRLSWQYHYRRAEIWKVIGGNAGIVISQNDEETPLQSIPNGTVINLEKGTRHRLVGLAEYGIIAEIWKHTDAENPSDENDIVRVQDDFGR